MTASAPQRLRLSGLHQQRAVVVLPRASVGTFSPPTAPPCSLALSFPPFPHLPLTSSSRLRFPLFAVSFPSARPLFFSGPTMAPPRAGTLPLLVAAAAAAIVALSCVATRVDSTTAAAPPTKRYIVTLTHSAAPADAPDSAGDEGLIIEAPTGDRVL